MVFYTNCCGPFLVKAYTLITLMSSKYWVPLKLTIGMGFQGICVDDLGPQALANVRIPFKPEFLLVHEKAQVLQLYLPRLFRGCV